MKYLIKKIQTLLIFPGQKIGRLDPPNCPVMSFKNGTLIQYTSTIVLSLYLPTFSKNALEFHLKNISGFRACFYCARPQKRISMQENEKTKFLSVTVLENWRCQLQFLFISRDQQYIWNSTSRFIIPYRFQCTLEKEKD